MCENDTDNVFNYDVFGNYEEFSDNTKSDDDKNEKEEPTTHTEDGVPIRKIYAGNLPKNVHADEIRSVFEKYGKVEDILVRKCKNNSKFSYAFVTFVDSEDAVRILNLRKHVTFAFRRLRLSPADSWHQPDFKTKPTDASYLSEELNRQLEEDNATFSETDPTIDCLNDDCLLNILNMLTLTDRIIVERVNKRWRSLCCVLWSQQRALSISNAAWNSWCVCFTTQRLRSVLIRCGNALKILDVSDSTAKLNVRTLQVVGKYCPNVESLNISGIQVTSHGSKELSKHCKQIRKLTMVHCPGITDTEVKHILIANENIEMLNLSENSKLTGTCLDHLQPCIEQINVKNCTSLQGEHFAKILKRFHNLRILDVEGCVTFQNNTFKGIVENSPQLNNFSLGNYLPLLGTIGTSYIKNLGNLVSLDLKLSNAVNDNTLILISKGCLRLETIDISSSREDSQLTRSDLSSEAIGALGNLPNLKTLYISYLKYTDSALEMLSSARYLQLLECRGCPYITDRGPISILEYCEELNNFDISGCDLITNRVIEVAVQVTEKRDVPLKFSIGGTNINLTDMPKVIPPSLEIYTRDHCVKHLRPDYSDDVYDNAEAYADSVQSDGDSDHSEPLWL